MEVNPLSPHCKEMDKKPLECSPPVNLGKKCADSNPSTAGFINSAAISWNKTRREWVGDQTERSERMQKDPILSWSMTYEDLLSHSEPFPERIPLPEMVDFLVDIWQDEGLFD